VTLPAKDGAKPTETTPGWRHGEDIAFRYTQYQGNEFPGLAWSAGPDGTKSYAIITQDTDFVARGAPILHGSVVNIPSTVTKLPAGMHPRGGSVCLNRFRGWDKWISASVMLRPGLAAAG